MNDAEAVIIYTTFPSRKEAKEAGVALVTAKLAACVNIFPKMTAIYEWRGEVQTVRETAMIIKTRAALTGRVFAALKPIHSYETPAFAVIEIKEGSQDYLAWIAAQTAPV